MAKLGITANITGTLRLRICLITYVSVLLFFPLTFLYMNTNKDPYIPLYLSGCHF